MASSETMPTAPAPPEPLVAKNTMRIAQESGCVVCDPFGEPLDAPLDTTTNVAFAAYANQRLAGQLIPIVREEVRRHVG